jgi:hypothetical protein
MASLNARVAALFCVLITALAPALYFYVHRSLSPGQGASADQVLLAAEAQLGRLQLPAGTENCPGDSAVGPTINRCWTTSESVPDATRDVEAVLTRNGVKLSGQCTVEAGHSICYYQGPFHGTELHAVIRPNISDSGSQEGGAQTALTLFSIPKPGSSTSAG